MADFCKKCSIEMFGHDCRDLAGLCEPGHFARVLCEGCEHKGSCMVDHEGVCHGNGYPDSAPAEPK